MSKADLVNLVRAKSAHKLVNDLRNYIDGYNKWGQKESPFNIDLLTRSLLTIDSMLDRTFDLEHTLERALILPYPVGTTVYVKLSSDTYFHRACLYSVINSNDRDIYLVLVNDSWLEDKEKQVVKNPFKDIFNEFVTELYTLDAALDKCKLQDVVDDCTIRSD